MATEEILNGEHITFEDDAEDGYFYLRKLYGSDVDEMDVFFYYAREKGEARFRDGSGHRFILTHESGDHYKLASK